MKQLSNIYLKTILYHHWGNFSEFVNYQVESWSSEESDDDESDDVEHLSDGSLGYESE